MGSEQKNSWKIKKTGKKHKQTLENIPKKVFSYSAYFSLTTIFLDIIAIVIKKLKTLKGVILYLLTPH